MNFLDYFLGSKKDAAPAAPQDEFEKLKKENIDMLSRPTPGDREGITPQFSQAEINAEAEKRARTLMEVRARRAAERAAGQAEADKLLAAEGGMKLPAAPIASPAPMGMAESLPARSGAEFMAQPMGMAESLKTRSELPKEPEPVVPAKKATGFGPARGPAEALSAPTKDYAAEFLASPPDAELAAAKDERRRLQLISDMTRAGKNLAAGLSQGAYKPDMAQQDIILKRSTQELDDIDAARKAKGEKIDQGLKIQDLTNKSQRQDSRSALSKAYRDMAAQYGFPVPSDMNAEGVKDSYPIIEAKMRMDIMARDRSDRERDRTDDKKEKELTRWEGKLRQEIQNSPATKLAVQEIQKVEGLASLIENYASNPSAFAGMAIQYGVPKALDPASAVRDAELKLMGAAGSWSTRAKQAFMAAWSGEPLSEESINDLRQISSSARKHALEKYEFAKRPIMNHAKKLGIDPGLIDFYPTGAAPAPSSGPVVVEVEGAKYTVPADQMEGFMKEFPSAKVIR